MMEISIPSFLVACGLCAGLGSWWTAYVLNRNFLKLLREPMD